jgi:3',5'-nucleoside bisphosphate phosphatase
VSIPGAAESHVDLHLHSTASDGTATPTEVVAAAKTGGCCVIALTDHDTMNGVDEARAAGRDVGVEVVSGVELSAGDGDEEVHILGLYLQSSPLLEGALANFRRERIERAERIVERLNALGIPLTMADVREQYTGGALGRPHVARALTARGFVKEQREAFDRYIGARCPAYVPKPRLTLENAISLVHEAGGLAFWAHPSWRATRARTTRLMEVGLDGLEIKHPSHLPEEVTRLDKLARELNLLRTGGSDWHGAMEGPRTIGSQVVPMDWVREHNSRLAGQRTVQ